jgi:hypothetical protein
MPAILEQYKQNSLFWLSGSKKLETTRPGIESEVGVAQKEKRLGRASRCLRTLEHEV